MNRLVVSTLIASVLVFAHSRASAEEGKVSQPTVTPEQNRSSNYSRATAGARKEHEGNVTKARRHTLAKPTVAAGKTGRTVERSSRAPYFYIYDAYSELRADRDRDGHHSEFRVRFDADVASGDALVYARLYLRRAGESQWFLYRETDDFWIFGQAGNDDYYVTTTLDAGYGTGEYDVLIDLYESGYAGIVATLGPLDSGALSYLPLEEVGLDVPIEMAGYSIRDVSTELIVDRDNDGYYSRFRINFDPDADFERRLVYARVWVRARGGDWIEEYVSDDWYVDTSGFDDEYVLDVDWVNGYPTSYYDVQIDLYDAATSLLVASAGSERAAFAQIPLEDSSRDVAPSSPSPGAGGSSSSREGGGGSLEWLSLLGLFSLALGAKRVRRGSFGTDRRPIDVRWGPTAI